MAHAVGTGLPQNNDMAVICTRRVTLPPKLLRRRLARSGTRVVVPDRARAGEPGARPASSENH